MPPEFYQNQIKHKLKNEIYMIGVDKRNQLLSQFQEEAQEQAGTQAIFKNSGQSIGLDQNDEIRRQQNAIMSQMIRPPLQFKGTQEEKEYFERQAKIKEQSRQADPQLKQVVQEKQLEEASAADSLRKVFNYEKKFNHQKQNQAVQQNESYKVPEYRLWDQEVPIDRMAILEVVDKMISQLTPHNIYAANYIKEVQKELSAMNIQDLTKTMHHLRLIHKYENNSVKEKGLKQESKHQFKNIIRLGHVDPIEKKKMELLKFAHHFKHHREFHTCKVPTLTKTEIMKLDVVYTARMFELKKMLNSCFDPQHDPKKLEESSKYWTLGQSVLHLQTEMEYGPFTNSELIDLAQRAYLNPEMFIKVVVPSKQNYYPFIADILTQINRRDSMLLGNATGYFNGLEKLLPVLRSDGVLHLLNMTIDQSFLRQLLQFFGLLRIHPLTKNSAIQQVVIDNVRIDQTNILKLLACFVKSEEKAIYNQQSGFYEMGSDQFEQEVKLRQNPQTAATNIVSLSLCNIEVSSQVIQFVSKSLLTQLFCLELVDLRYKNTLGRKNMLDDLIVVLPEMHQDQYINLVRLKISNIDLSKQLHELKALMDKSCRTLVDVDVSWANLNYRNLKEFFKIIINTAQQDAKQYKDGKVRGVIRQLNISYNPCHVVGTVKKTIKKKRKKAAIWSTMDDVSSSSESTEDENIGIDQLDDEISDLIAFMIRGFFFKKLVHIDLSGISSINPKELIKMLGLFGENELCPNLCAIHLSELGANFSEDIQDAITENFNIIWPKDVEQDHFGGLYVALMTYLDNWRGQDFRYQQADRMKYTDVFQNTLNENVYQRRSQHLMNQIQMEMIAKCKQTMQSGSFTNCQGLGRLMHKGHANDHFVIYKGINLPELIFNQVPHQDQNLRKRYFETDHFQKWKVSDNQNKKTDCMMCSKQKYTLIFYERNKQGNQNLYEIKDEQFVKKCRAEYQLRHSLERKNLRRIKTPLICGTVVTDRDESVKVSSKQTNPISNMTFDRKLRMIRADVFSLLSISTHAWIFKTYEHQTIIKNQIIQFLFSEFNHRAIDMGLFDRLVGWNKLLHSKCFKNQIQQTLGVNIPECVAEPTAPQEQPDSNHYVFGALLDPGYHQFIIYDPAVNKAFCQEFIVEPSNQWLSFPELPSKVQQTKKNKPLPPVFNKWIKDSIKRFQMVYDYDTYPYSEDGGKTYKDSFVPERFMKDTDEIARCEQFIRDNFDCIQTMYIDILVNSRKYPEICLQSLQQGTLDICNQYSNSTGDKFLISPAQIEIAFISATREDSPADRSLSRGEFLEMIIRMAYIKKNLAQEKMRRKLGQSSDVDDSGTITVEQTSGLGRFKKNMRNDNKDDETSSIHTDSSYESEEDESSEEESEQPKLQLQLQKTNTEDEHAKKQEDNKSKDQNSHHHHYDDEFDDYKQYHDHSESHGHNHQHNHGVDEEDSKHEHLHHESQQAKPILIKKNQDPNENIDQQTQRVKIVMDRENSNNNSVLEQKNRKNQIIQQSLTMKNQKNDKSKIQSVDIQKPRKTLNEHHHHHHSELEGNMEVKVVGHSSPLHHFSWRDPKASNRKKQQQEQNKQQLQQFGQMYRRSYLCRFETVTIEQTQDICSNLQNILKYGFWVYHESSLITQYRKAIQQDPKVVKELAKRLKQLRRLFKKHCSRGKFTFESALLLFELDGTSFEESRKDKKDRQMLKNNSSTQIKEDTLSEFWYPLTAFDIWPAFVRSMMTVLNEKVNQSKYNHLLLVEYYEFLGRVAFSYHRLRQELKIVPVQKSKQRIKNYQFVAEFLDKLLQRQTEIGNLKQKKKPAEQEQKQ